MPTSEDLQAPFVSPRATGNQNHRSQDLERAQDLERVNPEEAMSQVNGFGKFQVFAMLIMALMWGCVAMQMSSYVLFALPLSSSDSKTRVVIHTQDEEVHVKGAPSAEECAAQNKVPISIVGDDLIAHFGLICDKAHLVPLLGSALFFGGAFGVLLFSWLADKIGRALTLNIILVGMVASSFCALFAFDIYMYIAAKAFVGLTGISAGGILYTYFSEVSGGEAAKKWGTNGSNGGYAIGLLFLVCLAMQTQNWRIMELAITVIGLVVCIGSFILPESPRWLASAGRCEDATESFATIARWNSTRAPTMIYVADSASNSNKDSGDTAQSGSLFAGWSGVHLFMLGSLYLIMNIGYYGFSAASAELGSVYVNLAWVAISGAVAFYAVAESYEKYGKRITNVICFAFAALFSGACIFSDDLTRQIFAGLGLFFVTMVFSGIYQYTNDLFTTSTRGSANGVCGFMGKGGSVLAPYLGQMHPEVSMLMFTTLYIVCTAVAYYLPETKGLPVPDNVSDLALLHERKRRAGLFSSEYDKNLSWRELAEQLEGEGREKSPLINKNWN